MGPTGGVAGAVGKRGVAVGELPHAATNKASAVSTGAMSLWLFCMSRLSRQAESLPTAASGKIPVKNGESQRRRLLDRRGSRLGQSVARLKSDDPFLLCQSRDPTETGLGARYDYNIGWQLIYWEGGSPCLIGVHPSAAASVYQSVRRDDVNERRPQLLWGNPSLTPGRALGGRSAPYAPNATSRFAYWLNRAACR